jgi:hypothetical protein
MANAAQDHPELLQTVLDTTDVRSLALGAELRLDRCDDPGEPLDALADPAGHTFCIFVR